MLVRDAVLILRHMAGGEDRAWTAPVQRCPRVLMNCRNWIPAAKPVGSPLDEVWLPVGQIGSLLCRRALHAARTSSLNEVRSDGY